MMLRRRCPKPKARRVPARNARWYGRLATSPVEPVHDHGQCILVEIPANDKRDQRVQHRPKRSWQFVSTRSKDGKALAATGDCVTLQPIIDTDMRQGTLRPEVSMQAQTRDLQDTLFCTVTTPFTRTEQHLLYAVCQNATHNGEENVVHYSVAFTYGLPPWQCSCAFVL